ncbi:hypothetical protein [Paraburkholderia nodosa]|uniref:hypothetical protein n=1 Tax=Paraburkholderia nodosa TaxID=392320 RepID=UPI0009DCAAE9|nr:hypothetical protein [Paraburkholderia nodosa]
MKRYAAAMLFFWLFISCAHATSGRVKIGPLPAISNVSPKLEKSLDALRVRIRSTAKDCIEAAKGMNSVGEYNSEIKKMVDTSKAIVLQVSATMICDGIHSSSYQYGIAFEKSTGKRIDLNRIYNIAIRRDERLFIRPELADAVKSSYTKANENNQSCFSDADWQDDLTNLPITFSPQSDGSIVLYYAAPEVFAACFPALRLEPSALYKFRDANQASQYELP